jgi:hypothetical protein
MCGLNSICVIASNSTLIMDSNLNVFALIIRGKLLWSDLTQQTAVQWLCAGYVVVENQGAFQLSNLSPSMQSIIYIKDNGAMHPSLRSRVFGGVGTGSIASNGPLVNMTGTHKCIVFDSITILCTVCTIG